MTRWRQAGRYRQLASFIERLTLNWMLRLAHAPLASNKVRAVPMPVNMIIYLPLYQIILVFCNTQHNHPIESKPNINNNSSEQTLFSNSFFSPPDQTPSASPRSSLRLFVLLPPSFGRSRPPLLLLLLRFVLSGKSCRTCLATQSICRCTHRLCSMCSHPSCWSICHLPKNDTANLGFLFFARQTGKKESSGEPRSVSTWEGTRKKWIRI